MKVLLTGPTGRIGSRLAPRLLAAGVDLRVLARDAPRVAALQANGAEVVVGDLRTPGVFEASVKDVEAVVHVAASFRGVPDEESGAVNRDAAVGLARAALAVGASRFVFTSTNLVYGAGRGRPATEDDEPQPDTSRAYPASKAAAEAGLLRLQQDEGLDPRILRLAFVYGEGDPHLVESLNFARRWPPGKRLQMIHHADVDRAVLLALQAPPAASRIYNVGDDNPVTAAELLRLHGEVPGAEPRDDPDPWEGIVSSARIREELGFLPRYPSLESAVAADAL